MGPVTFIERANGHVDVVCRISMFVLFRASSMKEAIKKLEGGYCG